VVRRIVRFRVQERAEKKSGEERESVVWVRASLIVQSMVVKVLEDWVVTALGGGKLARPFLVWMLGRVGRGEEGRGTKLG
jgi:hypothetical protein